MSLKENIVAFLQECPSTTAGEVASRLGVDPKHVNAILYGAVDSSFKLDGALKWSLIDSSPHSARRATSRPVEAQSAATGILQARRSLARLKRGVPPHEAIDFLAIGMERLNRRLNGLFADTAAPRWFAVTGEYGEGKSFFRAFASQRALDTGFAIASLDVNKDEGALHQPQRHLSVILRSLRSPLGHFADHQGLSAMLRQWLSNSTTSEVRVVLNKLRNVVPAIPVGRDVDQFHIIVDGLLSKGSEYGSTIVETDTTRDVIVNAFQYKQYGPMKAVYRRPVGNLEWYYYGEAETWHRLAPHAAKQHFTREKPQSDDTQTVNPWYLPKFLNFMSAQDLAWKSSYARFHAAYRMQLAIEWLKLQGHRGLFLFLDEMDNVVRQISGKAHASCFRTLAWYCTSSALQALRLVFATTPEVMGLLDGGYRDLYATALQNQMSVTNKENETYASWNKEAEVLSEQGWSKCVTLNSTQRIDLFHRIVALHTTAWSDGIAPAPKIVEQLAKSPEFNTTRRWVRACVQLLDVYHQNKGYRA